MEFEKVLCYFILFAKKRYVGWLYEKSAEEQNLKYTGIVLKRRDNCKFMKIVYKKILKEAIQTEKIDME